MGAQEAATAFCHALAQQYRAVCVAAVEESARVPVTVALCTHEGHQNVPTPDVRVKYVVFPLNDAGTILGEHMEADGWIITPVLVIDQREAGWTATVG